MLAGLVGIVAAFGLLSIAGAALPQRIVGVGCVVLSACGAALALATLVQAAPPATLTLPVGLPGIGTSVSLDTLSAFFLLLLFVAATAASAASLDHDSGPTAPFLPLFIGAMALTLLAADAFALVAGFELMSLASFALLLTADRDPEVRAAALLYYGMAVIGAACLIPAMGLLAWVEPGGVDLGFAAIRSHPPAGVRAALVLALVVVGAGSKAGLAPFHVWLPPAHAAAPSHVSALMSGAMTKVAIYVLIRALFDLCGPAQPVWWGVPLLILGAAGAGLGALRANVEGDVKMALACSTIENIGLIAVGLGLSLSARAADLSPLAALALGGAMLHAMAHGVFKSLLFVVAGSIQHGAGTRLLRRLGGLIHHMPFTTACALVGGACLAGLPPTSGFAGEWTLFQAVLGAPRVGGLAFQTLVCIVAAVMALAAALAASAAVRLVGIAFLGRPRTPRAAAASEAGPPVRWAMIGLAALSVLIGLFPGSVLALANPALRALVSGDLVDRATAFAVRPGIDVPGYAAPAIAALLGVCGVLVVQVVRARAVGDHRRGPAWDCGFGAPPAWLPFGDPATQYGGDSFAQPLRRALGASLLAASETLDMPAPGDTRPGALAIALDDPSDRLLFKPLGRLRDRVSGAADAMQFLTVRRTLAVMFAALVLFLATIAIVEQL